MRVKKLILAAIGVMCLQTSAYGEWGSFQCRRDCRKDTCADESRKEACEANCAHLDPSILLACQEATPQVSSQVTRPTPPPRGGQVQSRPLPRPLPQASSMESASKGDEVQAQPETKPTTPRVRPQAQVFSKPPLERQSSVRTDEPSGLHQSINTGPSELKKQPSENKGPHMPTQHVPTASYGFTYTSDEVSRLLKGLLDDQIKEITTGCGSAINKIQGGLEIIKVDQNAQAIDLLKRGTGFIALIMGEKKEAIEWVQTFDVNKHLSEEDLKKYKIEQKEVNSKEKLSLDVLKKIYQKSQEKSLLVAQDCKVKSTQFQGWLEEYMAKREGENKSPRRRFFGGRGG